MPRYSCVRFDFRPLAHAYTRLDRSLQVGKGRQRVETRRARRETPQAASRCAHATNWIDTTPAHLHGEFMMMILMLIALMNAALLAMLLRARPAMVPPRCVAIGAPKSNAPKKSVRPSHLADDPQCIAVCVADIFAQMRQCCGIVVCEGGAIRIRNPSSLKKLRRTSWPAFKTSDGLAPLVSARC